VILIAALALTLAQQVPPRDAPLRTAAPTARITGIVVSDDAQRRPLRRARVTLSGGGLEMPETAITRDDGRFTFDRLPEGRFMLAAAKEAYVPMAYGATRPARPGTGVQVGRGQPVDVTLRLPRGAVITGTVLDIDGRPAVGVSVSAVTPRVGSGFIERQYATATGTIASVTDDRGVYRIYGIPAGDYFISAVPNVRQGIVVPSGTIQMMQRDNTLSRPVVLSPVLHPGVSDIARAVRVPVRAGEERAGIDVQLEYAPLATVSGTVSAPIGWSPARVTLWRTEETALPPSGPVATADDRGHFEIRGVPPGTYRVSARSIQNTGLSGRGSMVTGDVQYASAEIVVNGEDLDGVALSLQPGLTLGGAVVFESSERNAPALPSQLRVPSPILLSSAGGGWPMPAISIEGTRFRIDGVIPGQYRMAQLPQGIRTPIGSWWIKSIALGGRDLLDTPLNLEQSVEDAIVTFTDRVSEIAGTLRDPQGAPISTFYVIAIPLDRGGWFINSRRIAAVRAGRDGQWSIRNLPPGDYRVAAADLDPNEWFDPAVLEKLLPAGTPLRVTGPDKYTVDLIVR
jgi:hypothetical protein